MGIITFTQIRDQILKKEYISVAYLRDKRRRGEIPQAFRVGGGMRGAWCMTSEDAAEFIKIFKKIGSGRKCKK